MGDHGRAITANSMNLQSDDFELFGLPAQFAQHLPDIEQRWKTLQRQAHPDQFATEGASSQRLAMQYAVRINEAHNRLKDPVKRAAYLCALRGHPVDGSQAPALPPAFLTQQMLWREALEEALDLHALRGLEDQVTQAREAALMACEQALDRDSNAVVAADQVRQLMFIGRFAQDLSDRIDALLHPA